MSVSRREAVTGGLAMLAAGGLPPARANFRDGPVVGAIEGLEDFVPAIEAYTYLYPLVTMETDPPDHDQCRRHPSAPGPRWGSSSRRGATRMRPSGT